MILIDNPIKALWFVVLFLILQQLEGNLIYPKVVGNSVGLPSIWVLASVSVGGSLLGVTGMLMFIPLMSTVYSLIRDDVNDRIRKKTESSSAVTGSTTISSTATCSMAECTAACDEEDTKSVSRTETENCSAAGECEKSQ